MPEVILLQRSREDLQQLAALKPELLLERWLSHHLEGSAAVDDGEAWSPPRGVVVPGGCGPSAQQYAELMHALDPSLCEPDALRCAGLGD